MITGQVFKLSGTGTPQDAPDYDLEHQKAGQNLDNQLSSYERYDYPGRYKEDAAGKPFDKYRLEFERRETQQEDSASGGGSYYDSRLELIPEGQPWRAEQQPKPRVDGPQIAEITGPPGEEIYCDEYARGQGQVSLGY
jgi:type VI secretion system secreted protein VgrG